MCWFINFGCVHIIVITNLEKRLKMCPSHPIFHKIVHKLTRDHHEIIEIADPCYETGLLIEGDFQGKRC